VTVAGVTSIVNLNACGGMVGVVVDGILHLSKHGVDLNEILLRTGVRQGQVVLLGKWVIVARRGCSVHDTRAG
jgi:hypothetical protein